MNVQVIAGGVVVNSILLPDNATIAPGGASASWPGGGKYSAPAGSTLMEQAGAQIGWALSGGVLSAPAAGTPSLAALQAQTVAAARAASTQIVSAIYPTAAAQAAFDNAANRLQPADGSPPISTSPYFAGFNALASAYGLTATAFAALLVVAQTQSWTLHEAERTLEDAVAAATTAPEIATALAAFETAIGAVVAALNAALPSPITAPAAITISGVNA
jgi:hypothetical protein